MKKDIPRNRPIVTVIRHYNDKNSGRVTEARREIQRRFYGLDWKDQKRILLAFLESGVSDRNWAYSRLLDLWDESFLPVVEKLWEEHHEERCAWVVIRHFPHNYLKCHIDEFTADRDYAFICRRLAKDADFVIDKNKLSETDYLMVLAHSGREIADEEATDLLFDIVQRITVHPWPLSLLRSTVSIRRDEVLGVDDFTSLSQALYYLMTMGKDEVALSFYEWNRQAQKAMFQSEDYKKLRNKPLSDLEFKSELSTIAQEIFYQMIDKRFNPVSEEDGSPF